MAKETEFKETELKLRCAIESLPALTQLLDSIAKPQGSRQLNNTYYDTVGIDLAKAKAALRVRENNGQYEQTLKTRGQSVAGLQMRGEWNWPINSADLDVTLLQQTEIKGHLPANLTITELRSIFSTNFQRYTWLFRQNDTLIEVAVDNGQVQAGQLSRPLCECELELIEGDVAVLWQLAQILGEQAPLWISDVSKAERGYLLANLSPSWKKWPYKQQNPELMLQLQDALVHWQRALEAVVWEDKPAFVSVAEDALTQVLQLTKALACSEIITILAPWRVAPLTDLSNDLKNNKILALSVQKVAFAFYQFSEDQK